MTHEKLSSSDLDILGTPRFILTRRTDITAEELSQRMVNKILAEGRNLLRFLTPRQQEAIVLLYPQNSVIPRQSEVARELKITREAARTLDNRIVSSVAQLVDFGPTALHTRRKSTPNKDTSSF